MASVEVLPFRLGSVLRVSRLVSLPADRWFILAVPISLLHSLHFLMLPPQISTLVGVHLVSE